MKSKSIILSAIFACLLFSCTGNSIVGEWENVVINEGRAGDFFMCFTFECHRLK